MLRFSEWLDTVFAKQLLNQSVSMPVKKHVLLVSRSGIGQGYGQHVDNAYMGPSRTDLSFTIWLSEQSDYEGGALVLEDPAGSQSYRLPAGTMILYPSTFVHRVEPLLSWERIVVVGWIQSRIRDEQRRDLMFELDTARRMIYKQNGKCEEFDLLCRCYSNLLRIWGE